MKDRYRDFMITARIYAYLLMRKRAGKAHDIVLPHRDPDNLTVPCIACPWPGFNLPEGWKEAPARMRYVLVLTTAY